VDDWDNLARAVRRRRTDLGLTQADLAARDNQLSVATLRRIEAAAATSYRDLQLAALARALGWTSDTVDRLLASEQPAPEDDTVATQAAGDPEPGDDEIEIDYNSAIANMPEEVRQAVIRIVRPFLEGEKRS